MNLKSKNGHALEFGIIICLFGTQLSRLLMEVLSITFNTTNLVFVIGLLLLVPFGREQKNFFVMDKKMFVILIYQLFVLLYATWSGAALFNSLTGTAYTWFCVAFLMLMNWNSVDSFDGETFVRLGWWLLGIGATLLCWVASNGLRQFTTIMRLSNGSDRLTLSVIAFGFLVFFLCYETENRIEKFIGYVFVITSIIDIYLCTRKGMLISFLVVLGIHFYKTKKKIDAKKCLNVVVGVLVLVAAVFLILNRIPAISKAISEFWNLLKDSVLGYLGKADGMYNTGAGRNASTKAMLNELQNDFSIVEILFGKGYAYKDIDFPYLEAFSDFGIFGGILFLWVALLIPVKQVLKKELEPAVIFAQYYAIIAIFQNIYSGLPFGHYKFIPIIFLVWITNAQGKECLYENN